MRGGSLLCVWMGRVRVLSYLSRKSVLKGVVFRVSGPRDGWLVEKRWILGGVYQDAGQRHARRDRFRDGVE